MPHQDETTAWETRLASLQDGLASLNQIQRKWVYLEPIFARGALPQQQVCACQPALIAFVISLLTCTWNN